MKKTTVLSILFCIFTLPISVYCQELTHKIYWLTEEKYYSPVSQENVIVLNSEEEYSKMSVSLTLYDKGLVDDVKLASVEVEARYPGISDHQVFVSEIKKIAGSIGGNLAIITNALIYVSSTKWSDVSARVYRLQYKKDGQVLSGKLLENLSYMPDKFWNKQFIRGIENYEKYGDEREGCVVYSETKFHEIYTKMVKDIPKTLKLEERSAEKGKDGKPKGFSNPSISETEIKLFFQKMNEDLVKLKEKYPLEYEEYNDIRKKYYNTTIDEDLKKAEEEVLCKRKKKTSKPVNKNQKITK